MDNFEIIEEDDSNVVDIKVILVGEPGTGKTSLINVSVGQKFTEFSQSTLLSSFVPKSFTKNGKKYILNIWDTAGQEKYRAMSKIFIKNSKIVIFVYAINSRVSFEGLKSYWVNTIKEALGDVPVLGMVGNKCDLITKEEINENEAEEYAQENGIDFQLVTAKEDPEGFINFLNQLLDKFLEKRDMESKRQTIFINKEDKKNKGCCKK